MSSTSDAELQLRATMENYFEENLGTMTVEAQLYDRDRKPVLAQPIDVNASR